MVKIVTREPLTQLNETVITAIAMNERASEDRLSYGGPEWLSEDSLFKKT